MAKIPNWSYDDSGPFPRWVHDETGDSVEIGPADQVEYDGYNTPEEYQVTKWARDGLNNRVVPGTFTSLKKAKDTARAIARRNPEGKLVKSQNERHYLLEWGEGEPEV